MKNLSLLMCTAFCGLHTAQADAADNKKNERPNILWLTLKIPVLTNSAATATRMCTPPMQTVWLPAAYNS